MQRDFPRARFCTAGEKFAGQPSAERRGSSSDSFNLSTAASNNSLFFLSLIRFHRFNGPTIRGGALRRGSIELLSERSPTPRITSPVYLRRKEEARRDEGSACTARGYILRTPLYARGKDRP